MLDLHILLGEKERDSIGQEELSFNFLNHITSVLASCQFWLIVFLLSLWDVETNAATGSKKESEKTLTDGGGGL